MGPTEVWKLRKGDSVGMLEFSGNGLARLEAALAEKETKMALLGARLLEEQKRAAETAETARLRQAGESATLASISRIASMGIQQVLRWWVEWAGGDSNPVTFELNRDFVEGGMTPQDAVALMTLWQQGGISQETFLWLLQQGELLPPKKTVEDELADLLKQEPARVPINRSEESDDDEDEDEGGDDEAEGKPPASN
jgi:hypothetical protein